MAHETADEIERPINSAYFNVVFHEGPIGITFRRDKDREFIYVQNINENTQADNSDIEINDRLWSIHSITDHREFVLGLKHFDTKEFTSLLTYIKEHERPVKLQFRRVLVDEEDNRNGNQLPQHKQELQDDLDEFVLDRHEHEGQSHGIGISGTLDLPLPPRDKPGLKHVDSVLTNDQMLEDVCTQLDMTDYFKYNKIDMDGSDIETILEYIVKPNRTFYRSGFVDIYHAARSANRMSMPPVPPTTPASIFSGFWGSSAPAAPTARQNMPATLYDGLNAIAVSGYNLVAGVTVKRTKMVFLCNDVLIVANEVTSPTTAQHPPSPPKYHVEHMIDISSCKLRKGEYSDGSWLNTILGDSFHDNYIEKLDPHHLKTKVKEPYNTKAIQRVQVLEVISPLGTIVMVFYDIAERDEWFHLMVRSIKCMLRYYHNTDGSDDVVPLPLGWSHQYILGTMSSAIVNHEEHRIRELLQYIDAGIFDQDDILDVVDDEGFSPLLYACILRNTKVIELIHSHCSDVTVPDQLEHVWTPLHWCASQLNYAALECLITHIFDSEILVDSANRSPLVVACLEGRDATGSGDDVALSECMKILMDEHTDVDRVVELIMHPALEGNTACGQTTNQLCRRAGEGYNLTLLHILASAWQSNSCGVLLDRNALVNVPTICYYSPSSMGGLTAYTPLHLACLGHSLRFPMGEGFKYTHLLQLKDFDEDCLDGAIAEEEFLSVESGPSSNSSVGAVPGFGSIPGKYLEKNDSANGIATLEVLLQRGARPNAKTVVVPNLPQEYSQIVPYGKTVIHLLVENAAKWGDEAFNDAILMCLSYGVRLPVCEKTSDSAELNNFMSENELNGACLKFIYGKCLNSDVQAAVEQWTHKSGCLDGTKTNIAGDAYKSIMKGSEVDLSAVTNNTTTPVKVCGACGIGYTMFRREHRCRLCSISCCDDCSKKRVSMIGLPEARACDGCYNRARSEIAAHERQKMIANMRKLPANGNSSNGMTSEEYLQNQSRADAESRQQLFSGGNTSAGSNSTGAQMSSSTNETLNALGDAKIQLQQRGEKLKHASDRSAELAEASSEFAKMAKQLKEQNRSWF